MERVYKKLADKIFVRGNTVYFRAQLDHRRMQIKAPLQGSLAIDNRGRATPQLKQALIGWLNSQYNAAHLDGQSALKIPTIAQLVDMYSRYSDEQRIKTDKPSIRHVESVLGAVKILVEEGGWKWTDPIDRFTIDRIDQFLVKMVKSGRERVTAWTYASALKCLCATWTPPYYAREGFKVPPINLPVFANKRPQRYERPSKEALAQVKEWYAGLWERDEEMWLGATLMLQYGMRNSDVMRMEPSWFREVDGHVELVYQPHKTKFSSGRWCRSMVHPEIYERIQKVIARLQKEEVATAKITAGRPAVLAQVPDEDSGDGILGRLRSQRGYFGRINSDLSAAVPEFTKRNKSSYELRKICGDHVYQRFGAEAASAMLGDDIKTVSYYYAQPDRAAPTAIRIDEMI